MPPRTVALVVAGLAFLGGCGNGARSDIRIFDPQGTTGPELNAGDFVRSTAHASKIGGAWAVNVSLTKAGERKFRDLTCALARRGARLHRPQSFAVEVDGHVYSRPKIDYRAFPGGVDVRGAGIEFANVHERQAHELARKLRGG